MKKSFLLISLFVFCSCFLPSLAHAYSDYARAPAGYTITSPTLNLRLTIDPSECFDPEIGPLTPSFRVSDGVSDWDLISIFDTPTDLSATATIPGALGYQAYRSIQLVCSGGFMGFLEGDNHSNIFELVPPVSPVSAAATSTLIIESLSLFLWSVAIAHLALIFGIIAALYLIGWLFNRVLNVWKK